MAADENRAAAQRLRSALDPSAGSERGSRIATLRRREGEELRLALTEWEGQQYVSVRVWRQGRGKWFPTRRGLSVRVSELADLIDGLSAAADCITALLASQAQPDGSGPGASEAGPATAVPTRRRRRDAKGSA